MLLGLAGLADTAHAALSYGSGTYVNLCGSGTAATRYSCDVGCNPTTGTCQSQSGGVVKYTCSGRWDQCLESEGYWSNSESFGTAACGKTIQLSLYDKTCRRQDGTWNPECKLLGYMVWYSGDCWDGTGTPPITPLPTRPVLRVTPTVAVIPTTILSQPPTGTPTLVTTKTPTPTIIRACGQMCTNDSACGAGFGCFQGVCRNPSCPSDKSCFCGKVQTTPDTGGEGWILLGAAGVFGIGFGVKTLAKRIW